MNKLKINTSSKINEFKSVAILAGGLGTRLRSLWPDTPKCLVPINKKPFLNYILDHLIKFGIKEVYLLVGYKSEKIKNLYGNKYKTLQIKYSEEKNPLGTGGAVKNFAINSMNKSKSLIINGDTYFTFDLERFLSNVPYDLDSMVCTKINDSSRYGSLSITENNLLIKLNEKNVSKPGFINAGVYFLNMDRLIKYPKNNFSLELDYFPYCIGKNIKIFTHYDSSLFIDIGIPDDFNKAQTILKDL